MQHAESFRDLVVYQKARAVARRFFDISKSFPEEERYSLIDQGRRSSRSIGAQIAEAWAKRAYEKHFVSKLTDADGEQQETQHWVDMALDCAYLTQQKRDEFVDELSRIGRMLQSMMDKADLFCSTKDRCVCEDTVEYFADRSPTTGHRLPSGNYGGEE
jgi:four helix bundle protein